MAEIDRFLISLVEHQGSDLHMSTGCRPIIRKDGSIVAMGNHEPLEPQQAKTMLYEIMPEKNEKEFNEVNDTDFAYAIEGYGRFRVNVFRDHKGVCGVFRVIPEKIL